jgi:hypothetical protein
VILDEGAENAADPLLAGRDDRGVGNRQAQRVTKQRGHGEPVSQPADERRFRRGTHVAEPGVLPLERRRDPEHRRRERQQSRRAPLHHVELRLTGGIVRPRPRGRRGPLGQRLWAARWDHSAK